MVRARLRSALLALTGVASLGLGASAARAQDQTCRLALLLAMDVSASVDAREYRLQRDGTAAALSDPDVRRAILEGSGPVALAAYEWSGRQQQAVILPWIMIDSAAALDAAVATLARTQRVHVGFPTAAGYGLGFGAGMMQDAPPCLRKVIDVSGDGVNNEGFLPSLAYANFPFQDVTVNGLAILGPDRGVLDFYQNEIRHGPGAFVQIADGFDDFLRAMTLKLFRETNDMQLGALPGAPQPQPEDAG
ncbi:MULTISPECIES: DUF1194 domain-containing protein [Pseudooceanicola]|uniref:DUF1194 domain-containing protein n=1 Tax=Pseudooceanicola TaxID=1679449 RepID=UPI001EF03276|nr:MULTISPECIES: DUF1194 domain-containing protein [Pseudooceanicola]